MNLREYKYGMVRQRKGKGKMLQLYFNLKNNLKIEVIQMLRILKVLNYM